ncbi:hypothetical protein SCLARK_001428 [Spiroplasma clarkii]|nr:hypothetical protein SCLARK_001428 [Spiroplasma clarkii]
MLLKKQPQLRQKVMPKKMPKLKQKLKIKTLKLLQLIEIMKKNKEKKNVYDWNYMVKQELNH